MKVEDFNDMFLDQQAEYLWEFGIYITEKIFGNKVIKLYSLHDYHVEVIMDLTSNSHDNFVAVTEISQINNWVSNEDLKKMFNN